MKDSQRGMKKWASFNALNEQKTYQNIAIKKHRNCPPGPLSDEQTEEINHALIRFPGRRVIVSYYIDGEKQCEGVLTKVDPIGKFILIGSKKIAFSALRKIVLSDME